MKINACDVCYLEEQKIVKSHVRAGYARHLKVDLCFEHKDWTAEFKTPEALKEAFDKLVDNLR